MAQSIANVHVLSRSIIAIFYVMISCKNVHFQQLIKNKLLTIKCDLLLFQ